MCFDSSDVPFVLHRCLGFPVHWTYHLHCVNVPNYLWYTCWWVFMLPLGIGHPFSFDFWISNYWFLGFIFHHLFQLASICMSFIVAWWIKLRIWHSFFIFEKILVILINLWIDFRLDTYHGMALWLSYVFVISLILYHFIWYL